MPESLLTILKFLLLALLYLFFLRVLRAVWAEVSSPTKTSGDPGGSRSRSRPAAPVAQRGTPTRLRVIEPAAQRGQHYPLADELTVGRAAGCQVRVEDGFASQLHARLFRRDGQLYVEDLGSTNGTYVNRKGTQNRDKVTGPEVLRIGDRLCVGRTVLEVVK